jgi:Fusaric acid resistance protein-like
VTNAPAATAELPARRGPREWIRSKDPGYLAVKRSVRAAVVIPAVFGVAHAAFGNAQIDLFTAFGSFSLLLLVDFTGRPRVRWASYLVLFAVGCGFIALGTLASTHKIPAVAAMAVVGFLVLFAGIVAPQAATGATAALLLFVLPVAVAAPPSQIGPRLLGWVLAAAVSIPACMFVWPTPWHDTLRIRLSAALNAVARVADAYAAGQPDRDAHDIMATELGLLRSQFRATPYPPTSTASNAVALSKLVGRVEWVANNAMLSTTEVTDLEPSVRAVLSSVADTLRYSAALVCDGNAHPVDDPKVIGALRDSVDHLDAVMSDELDEDISEILDTEPGEVLGGAGADFAVGLDPGFHARALGIATEMVSDAALAAAGARTVVDTRLGVGESTPRSFVSLGISHLSFHSVWFRNAIRGAAGLALAVAVVEVTDVSHGFWVVLGTLSVLRSNALGTGATALRAIGGTAVGFFIGSAIMIGVSDHMVLLWFLLPIAVFVSGAAPVMISFAAGQAGFTVVVVILFNIIEPTGWKVGLTRIEDVAIGCAVSVVVGALFWPRGATAALGRALSAAFVANSGYLADAVDRLTITTRPVDIEPGQRESESAYLLLDDAFRQFFAERGAKVVSVETVSRLFTGANRIRLAAFTLARLPTQPTADGQPEMESVAVAGAVLRDSYALSHRWYQEFAEVLSDRRQTLDPPPDHNRLLHDVLRTAYEDARSERRLDRLRVTLQMLWADQLLETECQVQDDLSASADQFVKQRAAFV